jgi:hypothetical protein
MRLEVLGKLKRINDLIGSRTYDIQECGILPRPTTLPRVLFIFNLSATFYFNMYQHKSQKIKNYFVSNTEKDVRIHTNVYSNFELGVHDRYGTVTLSF